MNMKRRMIAITGALALWLTAGTPAVAQQPTVTQQVVTPPGSSFGLVPPPGFAPSTSFSGFADAQTQASFLFVELPHQAYEQMANGLTAEGLATRQIRMESREDVRFGGVPGVLIRGVQQMGGVEVRKFLLLFQAETFSGIVNVSLPPGASVHNDERIRASLLSLSVGTKLTLEQQRAALSYSFAETDTLKLRLVAGGGAAVLAYPEQDKRLLVIARALGDQQIGDRRAFMQQIMRQSRAAQNAEILDMKDAETAGCPGIEANARGTGRDGAPVAVIAWVGFCPGGYLRIEGITTPDLLAVDLVEFRKVRDSVAMKR
jgi:hypothetical protein